MIRRNAIAVGVLVSVGSLWAGSVSLTLDEAKAIRSLSIKPEIAANLKKTAEYRKKTYLIKVGVTNPLQYMKKGKDRDKLLSKYEKKKKVPIRITVSAATKTPGSKKLAAYQSGRATIQVLTKEDKKSVFKRSESMSKLCPT